MASKNERVKAGFTEWRAAVEKDLAGASFEKALVGETAEGLAVQPLYTETHAGRALAAIMAQREGGCLLCARSADIAELKEAIDSGADAVWIADGVDVTRVDLGGRAVVRDGDAVSSLPLHAKGADGADEIAALLWLGVARLGDQRVVARISVGRDTFTELCKLRALRLCWAKVCAAAGVATPLVIHAVGATRTLAARDPWVNMLRGTTQTFAAMLGGANLVTPLPFDEAIGAETALGRRVARNTALVLREESQLARVIDPAAGSYYLEEQTDALARLAWHRFQELEREGGLGPAFEARIADAWKRRESRLVRRQEPMLGVSEFVSVDEQRPPSVHAVDLGHRDSEAFERLRDRAEKLDAPTVTLVALGPPAEHRARLAFAQALFPVGGLRTESGESGVVACLCGSDERYAAEAVSRARALRSGGARRVLLAGRPGALEASLREAGVDDFVFLGCDAVAATSTILDVLA